jgi:hypothetical protein
MTKEGRVFELEEYTKQGKAEGVSLYHHRLIRDFVKKKQRVMSDNNWIMAFNDLNDIILKAHQDSIKAKPKKTPGLQKAIRNGLVNEQGHPTEYCPRSNKLEYFEEETELLECYDIAELEVHHDA